MAEAVRVCPGPVTRRTALKFGALGLGGLGLGDLGHVFGVAEALGWLRLWVIHRDSSQRTDHAGV